MFIFVLNILRHNLLGMNRPEGWVRAYRKWVRYVCAWVRIVRVRKIYGYETTGKLSKSSLFSKRALSILKLNILRYRASSRKMIYGHFLSHESFILPQHFKLFSHILK